MLMHHFVSGQFNYNVGDAVNVKMEARLQELMADSAAPFRIIINHMNLLSQTRPEFDRVCISTKLSILVFPQDYSHITMIW